MIRKRGNKRDRDNVIGALYSCSRLLFTPQGIGVLGTGATPQIADAQRGRGGVGISNSFPWVAASPPRMQLPE
jgi:hypothetical protein